MPSSNKDYDMGDDIDPGDTPSGYPTTSPWPCLYLACTRHEISLDTCPHHCCPSSDTPGREVWLYVPFNTSIITQKKLLPEITSWLPELLAVGLPDTLGCKLCGYPQLHNEINGSDKFILLTELVMVGRYHSLAPTHSAPSSPAFPGGVSSVALHLAVTRAFHRPVVTRRTKKSPLLCSLLLSVVVLVVLGALPQW